MSGAENQKHRERLEERGYFSEYWKVNKSEAPRTTSGANLEPYSGGITNAERRAAGRTSCETFFALASRASMSTRVLSETALSFPSAQRASSESSRSAFVRWRFATRAHALG